MFHDVRCKVVTAQATDFPQRTRATVFFLTSVPAKAASVMCIAGEMESAARAILQHSRPAWAISRENPSATATGPGRASDRGRNARFLAPTMGFVPARDNRRTLPRWSASPYPPV